MKDEEIKQTIKEAQAMSYYEKSHTGRMLAVALFLSNKLAEQKKEIDKVNREKARSKAIRDIINGEF